MPVDEAPGQSFLALVGHPTAREGSCLSGLHT
jgi:hypothetical protein